MVVFFQGKKAGHLLLVPISMGPNEPVLGILVVDTIAKSRKTNEFCPITHEEKVSYSRNHSLHLAPSRWVWELWPVRGCLLLALTPHRRAYLR